MTVRRASDTDPSTLIRAGRQTLAHDVTASPTGHPSLTSQARQEGVAWNTSTFLLASHKRTGGKSHWFVQRHVSVHHWGRREVAA